jgi:hypothetical protein
MTLERLHQEFLTDLQETKGEVLRETTLKAYGDVWRRYLLPAVGQLTLPQVTVEVVRQIKRDIPVQAVAQRQEVRARRQPRAPATQLCPGLRSPDGMGVA